MTEDKITEDKLKEPDGWVKVPYEHGTPECDEFIRQAIVKANSPKRKKD
jgi:hypothetical protein